LTAESKYRSGEGSTSSGIERLRQRGEGKGSLDSSSVGHLYSVARTISVDDKMVFLSLLLLASEKVRDPWQTDATLGRSSMIKSEMGNSAREARLPVYSVTTRLPSRASARLVRD